MMEENGYLILTACLCLLFFLITLLAARYRTQIQLYFRKNFRVSTKIYWDTLVRIIAVWAFILFLKKFIYYFPFEGVSQSQFSIWWVDKNVLLFIYYLLFLLLCGTVLIGVGIGTIAGNIKSIKGMLLIFLFVVWVIACPGVLENLGLEFDLEEVLYMLVFTPLLFLKMVCSGKYLGLFTSLVLAYFIVDTYEELKPQITRNNAKFLAPFGFLFWFFLVFSFTYFPLDWEERLQHQLQTAENRSDFLEILDTTKSMKNLRDESYALKRIAMKIAQTGEIQRAKLVAEQIPDEYVKSRALEEIREKIEEQ